MTSEGIIPATSAPSSSSSTPSLTDLASLSFLTLERISRQRILLDDIQYRVKYENLLTETWKTRSQLLSGTNNARAEAMLQIFDAYAAANPDLCLIDQPWSAIIASAQRVVAMQPNNNHKHTTPAAVMNQTKDSTKPTTKKPTGRPRKRPLTDEPPPVERVKRPYVKRKPRAPRKPKDAFGEIVLTPSSAAAGANEGDDTGDGEGDNDSATASELAEMALRGEYEVERLIGDVWESGVHWFRVKWKGYSDYDNSWQRPEDLSGCQKQIKHYWHLKAMKLKQHEIEERNKWRKANQGKKGKHQKPNWFNPEFMEDEEAHSSPAPVSITEAAVLAAAAAATGSAVESSPPSTTAQDALPNQASPSDGTTTIPDSSPHCSMIDEGDCTHQILSFPTLSSAQNGSRPADNENETKTSTAHKLEQRRLAAAAAAPETTSAKPSPTQADGYEDVAIAPVDASPDTNMADEDAGYGSDSSNASIDSLLVHPAHKHASDTPQCIIAHDYYECENDKSTWLLLVKWKNKPVAECSWEDRNSLLINGPRKRYISNYLKTLSDAKTRNCIKLNIKPTD